MALLITGPQAVGKTTVARLVAERFDRGVHVEGDALMRFVVTGRAKMTPEASDEAVAQLRLRYELSAHVAQAYERAGFTAVVEDVVAGPLLEEFAPRYERVVVLFPPEKTIADRERHASWVYRVFADETPRLGTWIDTSNLTPEQTAAAILNP